MGDLDRSTFKSAARDVLASRDGGKQMYSQDNTLNPAGGNPQMYDQMKASGNEQMNRSFQQQNPGDMSRIMADFEGNKKNPGKYKDLAQQLAMANAYVLLKLPCNTI